MDASNTNIFVVKVPEFWANSENIDVKASKTGNLAFDVKEVVFVV